jgi:Protein of unknown function (DUF3168)
MTMKDLRPALVEYLLADTNIAAAVGDRIYPVIMKQGVMNTSIVYNRISGFGESTYSGPAWITRPRYQLDSYATRADAAAALADLIKQRLEGFSGVMGTGGQAINVLGIFYDGEHDEYDPDARMYRVRRDYFVWFQDRDNA